MFRKKDMSEGLKLGLALGGGGARGIAHVGVLKVFERERIRIDMIVGTSIGAIVGASFAAGIGVGEIEDRAREFFSTQLFKKSSLRVLGYAYGQKPSQWKHRIDMFFKKNYLMAQLLRHPSISLNEEFSEIISFFIPDINVEDTVIPFCAVATDFKTGELVYLRSGSLRKAVLASSAVPGAVMPIDWDGKSLADGGVICLVPATVARELGADFVVSVSLEKDICTKEEFTNVLEVFIRTNDIQGFHLTNVLLRESDVIIRPDVGNVHWAEFHRAVELVEKGEKAAEQNLEAIKGMLRKQKETFTLDTILRFLLRHVSTAHQKG
jgi:NTE family protein